ncbi:replicative DNA helicase [Sandaracinus amylolyticus]|uniref:Replicative DNA helicase n=1 Tax=Sandaracinus amylolyticus TaxID=927083 RepID=A0A0F6SG61_9BACT|nr:replicative DNA helicase [Sandaracinus amylolyticus]AKF08134.1 Replicative DNA helicase [Sandaracinus amylolyticus]
MTAMFDEAGSGERSFSRGDSGAAGGRVPPHSLEAERAVLGGVLLENSALNTVTQILSGDDFYSRANGLVFDAMCELFRRGQPVDTVTLRAWLVDRGQHQKAGGDEHLLGLTNTIPTVANIEHYSQIVREKATVRRLITACHEIAATGYGDYGEPAEYLDQAEKRVFEVGKQHGSAPYEHIKDVVLRTFEQVQEAARRKEAITGLPTGLHKLDEMTAGLKGGELIIIAGRPGMGKTAFALNVAIAACQQRGVPIAVFSLEMRKEELVRRLLCSEAKVDGGRMRTGMLSREDWARLASSAGPLTEMPFFIDDTPAITLMQLRGKARRLKSENHGKLGMIVIDYLQLMRSGVKNDSREQEISEISRSLKGLSKELDCPVIALSQLNRGVETRPGKDKRPQLADLRESGAIEQDADVIMFVYRPEVYAKDEERAQLRGLAEIIVGKQRAGPTGIVRCRFFHEFTRFENLAEGEFEDYDGGGDE